ncbi:DNA repair protein RadA [candidate division WWE3 bacterium RIFOXYC1_FULL_40_10]|nr:MAG: DNA repair protein RadA [candidate division WWE3 bacterium RIFOXYB1_FULL_40_22]OGC61351.1 MAG: DNA repair protein RadA [candidate division WWE3 bacterium RIFOXYA1_FULL_40_11]OGC65341.1 MAG: DNA repair protein RadA [candidate division WWE3 bacterium RIFOXYB2_FULL_41_6]OGC65734.1 MAG: DNA repair protein RadA [candidate division WWE3 bacterium RIFOXYC1_FULL_40_10]OGC70639.1 MAG: DNA repair protein RadA [candidate division WWE3 bacterium RIFOXYD1_FULL_40_11]HLD51351.1 DNA repair protein Ra
MPKLKKIYICQSCAYQTSQWVGQCPQCNEWNTFSEDVIDVSSSNSSGRKAQFNPSKIVKLSQVKKENIQRVSSNITEFDRVLGGGFVPGQVILLAGDPGIGKSTLLTQICSSVSMPILYVCGEESPEQIKLRTTRVGYKGDNLNLLSETNIDQVLAAIHSLSDLKLVIVDSIQTLYSPEIGGMAGAISQIKGCTQILTSTAKDLGVPIILVGHVTKEGAVAGPKILEHMVDTVLQLEGDSQHMYRTLRTSKNRFGPVSEVGIFEMQEKGMIEVTNPSELFLEQRLPKTSGSVVTVVMEGHRPILFEVQALTTKTSFGYPRRTTSGYNNNRLQVILAILQKRAGIDTSSHDVYVSVAGGFKISEYSSDLAVCLAVASSLLDKPIKENSVVFGECGLNGEIRRVSQMEKRIAEAKKLGYKNIVSPMEFNSIKKALSASL